MKNTTSKKLSVITIMLVAALFASLFIWQQSQSKVDSKPVSSNAVLLTSTTLKADRLFKQSTQLRVKNKHDVQIIQVNSLQGTQPDGAVNLDEQGNVKADKELHRLFDYYLSTLGEQELLQIKKQLLMSASDYLSLDQLEQLRDYFDQYVQYLESAGNFAVSFNDDEPLDQRLIQIKQLRVDLLGQVMADGFFADEHAYATWVLQQDTILTDDLTAQQIKWLEAENHATAYQDVLLQNQQFESAEVSEFDKQLIRAEVYGEAVAERLALLDNQQSLWQNKVRKYINARELVSNQSELQSLNNQYSATAIKRLNAYWQHHLTES